LARNRFVMGPLFRPPSELSPYPSLIPTDYPTFSVPIPWCTDYVTLASHKAYCRHHKEWALQGYY
jgi:hypothetical protein